MPPDPYKYFRIEARELLEGLSQGVLELEKGTAGKEPIGRLLRLAHTLKGASRVVRQPGIGDLAHAIEDSLTPFREGQESIPPSRLNEVLRLLDAIGTKLALLDPVRPQEPSAAIRPAGEEPLETVRVELGEMDQLLEGVTETTSQLEGLDLELAKVDKALSGAERLVEEAGRRRETGNGNPDPREEERVLGLAEELRSSLTQLRRSLGTRVEQARRELFQVRETAHRIRLLPASVIFASLERAARDAAQSLGKRIGFHAGGGDNRLDAQVLGPLRDALLQGVRNSVAHGIESESERQRSGKDPVGQVHLSVQRQGNRMTFICRDDGRGIDVEAVRRAALRKGIRPDAKTGTWTAEDAVELLLRGGLSTTGSVDEVSGRGIGLDVVRETAARLKGRIQVRTESGRGTSLEITVPVSLSSLPALLLEAGGTATAIPLDAVPATRRIEEKEIARTPEGDSVLYEGKGIPLLLLSRLLGGETVSPKSRKFRSIVVVRSGAEHAALEVDRVLGTSSVVVRHLPEWLGADPVVAGAALDERGSPQVVLDPEGLVRAARQATPGRESPAASRLPVLIIDDSLTTRMLEQSILDSAGYEVELAVSGLEALAKARGRRYGLFIVDVEMPGMDGFEFIAETRQDPRLRDIPAILVTSRNAPEDKKRGVEVGASAYIGKSEFDQVRLLKLLEELLG
jgi:two-component system chemotaxis sensor kinase CheA